MEDRTPLELALESIKTAQGLQKNNQILKACYLRDFDPNSIYKLTPEGRLPLHLALDAGIVNPKSASGWLGPSPQRTLGQLDPLQGLYPFQIAAASNATLSTIYSLLLSYPDVVGEIATREAPAKRKEIPVDILLNANPDWITPKLEEMLNEVGPAEWDELQMTLRTPVDPLWHQLIAAARAFGCPLPLLRMLIQMHPEKLMHEDKRGWLPLHHAILAPHGDQNEAIRMILKACPKAACHRDKNGLLPFHLAILSGKGIWLLKLLLEYNPAAMYEHDSRLGLPPALFAAQWSRSGLSTVYHLLSSAPELVVGATRAMSLETYEEPTLMHE